MMIGLSRIQEWVGGSITVVFMMGWWVNDSRIEDGLVGQ